MNHHNNRITNDPNKEISKAYLIIFACLISVAMTHLFFADTRMSVIETHEQLINLKTHNGDRIKQDSSNISESIEALVWTEVGVILTIILFIFIPSFRKLKRLTTDLTQSNEHYQKLISHLEQKNVSLEEICRNAQKNEETIGIQTMELMKHRQFSDAVLNTAQVCIISIKTDGTISLFNQSAEKAFGYSRHEIIGENISALIPSLHQKTYQNYIDQFIQSGRLNIIDSDREIQALKKDGTVFPINIRISEIKSDNRHEFVGFINDLTEIKNTKDQLSHTENHYRAIVEDQPNLICRYTPDYTLTFVNKAYCSYFKQEADQIIGSSILEILPDDIIDWFKQFHQSLNCNAPFGQHEDQIITANGSTEWQHWATRAICNDAGQVIEFQAVGTNTTERKVAELKIIEAKKVAEKANKIKSQFLSNMSHELRTPLNSIIGFSQLLESDTHTPLTDIQKDSISYIHQAGKHLLLLINEILDLSKIEAGQITLSLESIDLTKVIKECLPLIEASAQARNITLNVDIAAGEDKIINGDYLRIKQVILNLLSNAIKYNHENGHVDITLQTTQNFITLNVKDTGIGIKKDLIPLLFKPFNRLSAEPNAIEGTGIGLCITKNLIAQMDGKIGVESILNKGSHFWVTFPLINATISSMSNLSDQPPCTDSVEHVPPSDLGLYKAVYIIDRQQNIQQMKYSHLHLHMANNAEIGLELIENIQPDAIIIDLDLPKVNGFEIYTEIRTRFDFALQTPIIAVSANAMIDNIEQALSHGFADYLPKPISSYRLKQAITETIATINVIDNR